VAFRFESDISKSLLVLGDRVRFRQILSNLVSNAVKFTEQGHVEVIFSAEKLNEKQRIVHFKVRDTGIGIPEEKSRVVFEKFTQSDMFINRRFGGSGLGLTIAKDLICLMGGDIYLESEIGVGTTFTVDIPMKTIEDFTATSSSDGLSVDMAVMNNDYNFKILIVDDSEDNIFLMKHYFQSVSCEISVARDGLQAYEMATGQRYDIIFMDIQMPIMDGKSSLQKIRQWEQDQGVASQPIIALTAHAMHDEVATFFELGFSKYLSKPVRKQEVLDVVADLLLKE
jgi:CheY-like chemotaxis protein